MIKEYTHNRLLLLVIVSACLHFIFLYQPNNIISIPSQKESSYIVQLKTINHFTGNKSKEKQEKSADVIPKTTANKIPGKNTESNIGSQTGDSKPSFVENQAIRATLISKIKTKFTRYFKYPKFAQRKGWQGKVDLGFYISKHGDISDIYIKHSSGYKVLDQAAYDSLAKIKNITVTNWPFNIKQQFNLPVIYKLYEG